jgi:RecB family exonuclease
MRAVSIGVQAACMIDCDVRVPLLVFAKLRKIDVKDPVDLAVVRRGRFIHAAFEQVASRLDAAGTLGDGEVVRSELSDAIADALPELESTTIETHASALATTIAAAATADSTTSIDHERQLSVCITPGVKVTGRVDTIVETADGWVIVERKTGARHDWHARQVQLYAEMVAAKHLGTSIARLEIWYSGLEPGSIGVPCTGGEILDQLRAAAMQGEALDDARAREIVRSRCRPCPRADCGLKHLARALW